MSYTSFADEAVGKSQDELLELFLDEYSQFQGAEAAAITSAWSYLCQVAEGRVDSQNQPYCIHGMRVAAILAERKLDYQCVMAGFLHNVLSFERVSPEEISEKFGPVILRLIDGTTRITNLKIKNKTQHQADSIRKMLFAMVEDIRVILVMLADRLDRIRNLSKDTKQVQKQVAQEAIDIWAPLANRLGMSSVKSELEDLSLKYSNPDVYAQIKKVVAAKKQERSDYLAKAQQEIYKAASRAGIEVSISSRAKHFYSIYQKMRKRNKGVEELFDLLALRVLCENSGDCYVLVGLVHGLWKPLDGRFKDYIAMPKANGYQSLHTTVMFEGRPLEIQIRTTEMHSVAEYGVASHLLYKQKLGGSDRVGLENLSIINQLKQLQPEQLADEVLFSEIREELLGDSIFVFTPKGDVVELPAGSTAVDFAYQIHSAVGEKIVGAKADGHIIPLSRPLKNTQIVDIITSPKAHPTQNQLQLVRTAKARSKIRGWLTQNDPTFDNPFAKSPSEQGLRLDSDSTGEAAAVHRAHKKGAGKPSGTPPLDIASGSGKIRIGNTTNFLVSRARCCEPQFGDAIVGYVSRGRGIIIHREDCHVFSLIPNRQERTLEVEWDREE